MTDTLNSLNVCCGKFQVSSTSYRNIQKCNGSLQMDTDNGSPWDNEAKQDFPCIYQPKITELSPGQGYQDYCTYSPQYPP